MSRRATEELGIGGWPEEVSSLSASPGLVCSKRVVPKGLNSVREMVRSSQCGPVISSGQDGMGMRRFLALSVHKNVCRHEVVERAR